MIREMTAGTRSFCNTRAKVSGMPIRRTLLKKEATDLDGFDRASHHGARRDEAIPRPGTLVEMPSRSLVRTESC